MGAMPDIIIKHWKQIFKAKIYLTINLGPRAQKSALILFSYKVTVPVPKVRYLPYSDLDLNINLVSHHCIKSSKALLLPKRRLKSGKNYSRPLLQTLYCRPDQLPLPQQKLGCRCTY